MPGSDSYVGDSRVCECTGATFDGSGGVFDRAEHVTGHRVHGLRVPAAKGFLPVRDPALHCYTNVASAGAAVTTATSRVILCGLGLERRRRSRCAAPLSASELGPGTSPSDGRC